MTEVEDLFYGISDMHLLVVMSEVNMIDSNMKEWWGDTDATRHICSDRRMFISYN